MTNLRIFGHRTLACFIFAVLLGACAAGTQVTRVQDVSENADTPYKKILIIALLSSYDGRRYLEKEVALQLAELGTDAVASTTMMNTMTPVTRKTFLAMVDEIGADAVLITQLISAETDAKTKTARPEATYNIRPTYYYNVWSVDLTEYVEPAGVEYAHSLALATQLYAVSTREAVWGIEAKFKIIQEIDQAWSYSVFPDQAKVISRQLSKDGLIAR
jgi:hypothetical protein